MSYATWSLVLKSKMKEIKGIEQVHDYTDLPVAIGAWPSLVILPVSGVWVYSSSFSQDVHQIRMALYLASVNAPEAYKGAIDLMDEVRDKVAANHKLNNTVEHIEPSKVAPSYDGPTGVRYADKIHLGTIFNFEVKENTTGDFTVAA